MESLDEGRVRGLLNACGYHDPDIAVIKRFYRSCADVESTKIDAAPLLSVDGLLTFLSGIGIVIDPVDIATKVRFLRAFDRDGDEFVDIFDALVGLCVLDPTADTPSDLWTQCRLEMIFRFYDLDGDGALSWNDFEGLVKDMVVSCGVELKEQDLTDVARNIAARFPSTEVLSQNQFVQAVMHGVLESTGMNLDRLFRTAKDFRLEIKKSPLKSTYQTWQEFFLIL